MRAGARKISETKEIENPEEIAGGDKAIQEFIDRLDMRHLPMDVRRQYLAQIRYHNDCWADIEEKAEAKGRAEGEKEKAFDIAKKMLNRNVSINAIAEDTGLTVDEIKDLKGRKK